MPLVRFQVRNEYSLGQPQLYKEVNREDPKAVLDGVAVAGLVGILRQLGDLAEFAAEVFHGLQEQVTTTASRSHKLMVRVQHIEAALPPLEKAVLAQTSHIHFAYTSGVEWHPRIRNEKNHFISNDLPRFIMDSYEECRDPPRLHLLDKFDTGGPGSCLKRYSDPTFFKKASATPDEANAEKSHRSRKAQRSKKQRGAQRNRDVRGASVSNHSSRMQCIPPIVNGGSSSSPTVSTAEMARTSDLRDNSISFNSRTESGYIEYAAHPSSSMQGEDQDSKESPTFNLEQHDDTLDAILPNGQTGFADDHSPGSSLQDQVTSGSSCVNWDEKAEIVDTNGERNCIDEITEMLPTKDDLDSHEGGVGNFRIVDQKMDVTFDDENILESISSRKHTDEIESEPDNFMDALNTIESESENDQECQTKREVEHFASVVNSQVAGENTVDCSDHQPPTFESHTATSSIYLEEERPADLPNSVSIENPIDKEMPKIATEPSNSDQTAGTNRADIFDCSRLESVSGDSTSSGSGTANVQDKTIGSLWDSQESPAQISRNDSTSSCSGTTNQQEKIVSSLFDFQESPAEISNKISAYSDPGTTNVKDKITSSLCESQEAPADISRSNSINFWTNGGLLGLEPSKPPDFTMPSPMSHDSNRSGVTVGLSNHDYELIVDDHERKLSMLGGNSGYNGKDSSSKDSISWHLEDGISSKKVLKEFSDTELYPMLGNDVHPHNAFSPSVDGGLKEANEMESGTVFPVSPYDKSTSNEANQENDENSFRVFGLGRRLLENGFGRKVPYTHDGKSEPARYSNLGVLEQRNEQQRVVCQAFSEIPFKEQYDQGFSYPPSPPLEHMKISFHPVEGIESSILKLKLSDGNRSRENARDMFHSFQLIPEPAVPLHEFGSDSDDDTFCRSSPYISDDCLSHHSESNSEEWDESIETLESKNHELYDALCGISSVEHMSTSLGLGGISDKADYGDGGINSAETENCPEHSFSHSLLDLPSLDALQPVLKQEAKDDLDAKDLQGLRCPGDSTPGPPPLPPVQWRVSRPSFDVTEEKQDVSDAFKRALNTGLLGSITLKQSKPAPVLHQQTNEESITTKLKEKDQQVNGRREADQALDGKGMEEKEDFLQQIRTKSFNLRRTVTSNPTTAPVPVTHVKVTAILEKANAIRQAVGSDDGDEDTWSDT